MICYNYYCSFYVCNMPIVVSIFVVKGASLPDLVFF